MNLLYYIFSCIFCIDEDYSDLEYIIDYVLDLDSPEQIYYEKN
jgi:hypothetical protein